MLPLPDLWYRGGGVGRPPASARRDVRVGFSCRICSTKCHFPWAGGSGLGRSSYSPPQLPLQVPHAPSQPAAGSESRRFANKHSKKALKASLTLGILLGMFFVAWLPFFVTNVTQVSKFLGSLLAERAFFPVAVAADLAVPPRQCVTVSLLASLTCSPGWATATAP